jgi:VIT1/CCC1 family predicted Fe2+/Mn2+ transporter
MVKQQEALMRQGLEPLPGSSNIKTATQPPLTPGQRKETLNERKRVARLSRIRQFVFGSLDGLLVPLGVVSGVAGGTGNIKAVIVAGLAEAFAGAISMGAGEFLSGRAEAQVQQAEVKTELQKIHRNPAYELQELIVILESEGVKSEDAIIIAKKLHANPEAFVQTMVQKELGLDIEPDTARIGEGVTMALSYVLASIVPLISYFFLPLGEAFIASIVLTIIVLAGIGIVRGRLAKISLFISALEVVAVGAVSGLGGYFLGVWLPKLLGY